MKAWEIVGYTYEAACHCVGCTEDRFGIEPSKGYDVEDSEGNTPKPIFASDEGWEEDMCGTCGERLEDCV